MKRRHSGLVAALLIPLAAQAGEAPQLELRVQGLSQTASTQGPLAWARTLDPGLPPAAPDTLLAEAELRHTLRVPVGAQRMALGLNAAARHLHAAGGARRTEAWMNELHAGTDLGAWSFTVGKRVLGWDVGYGFRPNDVVQQEARRTLTTATPEGRPLLMAEYFGADSALSLVWVNPQHQPATGHHPGAQESALAVKAYWREGAADWHAVARVGEHTRGSLGGALAWVATDEVEVHASARYLARHDAWRTATAVAGALERANPWSYGTRGATLQWLLGLNWTGSEQQGVLLEYWHDGTALPDADWRRWQAHNQALAAMPAPAAARAGNLAWQASPWQHPNLRQDNLFLRLSWQAGAWQLSLDALYHPRDGGRVTTAGLSWQGDRWKLSASLRHFGGSAASLAARLPQRHQGALTAQWTY